MSDRVFLPAPLGSLDAIVDSERRPLRPIGSSAHEVAERTGALLAGLVAPPGVLVFCGVCPMPDRSGRGDAPPIPHAVTAGRRLLLIESVAWPAGRYETGVGGRVHCDGVYIGQSALPLIDAVRRWRRVLPGNHRVSALVVVHPPADGGLTLPVAVPEPDDLAWVLADDAARHIRRRMPRRGRPVSRHTVTALMAATGAASPAATGPAAAGGD
jgi:hypothetical protein